MLEIKQRRIAFLHLQTDCLEPSLTSRKGYLQVTLEPYLGYYQTSKTYVIIISRVAKALFRDIQNTVKKFSVVETIFE